MQAHAHTAFLEVQDMGYLISGQLLDIMKDKYDPV